MLWRQRNENANCLAPPEDEIDYALPSDDDRRAGTMEESRTTALDQWVKAIRATEIMEVPLVESIP
jgi:hypothetical protein